jgi:hypothetical protein
MESCSEICIEKGDGDVLSAPEMDVGNLLSTSVSSRTANGTRQRGNGTVEEPALIENADEFSSRTHEDHQVITRNQRPLGRVSSTERMQTKLSVCSSGKLSSWYISLKCLVTKKRRKSDVYWKLVAARELVSNGLRGEYACRNQISNEKRTPALGCSLCSITLYSPYPERQLRDDQFKPKWYGSETTSSTRQQPFSAFLPSSRCQLSMMSHRG